MDKISLLVKALKIPLRGSFKQASFTRVESESLWVEAKRTHRTGYGEGCPRTYVTGESLADAKQWILDNVDNIVDSCKDLDELISFVNKNEALLDEHPAAWGAVELALLDLFARENNASVEGLLNLPEITSSTFNYTAVLSDDEPETFIKKVQRFKQIGFDHYKIKISGELDRDRQKFELLKKHLGQLPKSVRVDANNLWGNNFKKANTYFEALPFKFMGIEEPFDTGNFDAISALSQSQETAVILDESGARKSDLEKAVESSAHVILNIKVAKAGGILRSLALIDKAKELNIPVIVGAHVGETSVLTRAGMLIAAYAGQSLRGHEGGFGEYLLTYDVVEPVVQLGKKGQINLGLPYTYSTAQGPVTVPIKNWELGWGLHLREPLSIHRQ